MKRRSFLSLSSLSIAGLLPKSLFDRLSRPETQTSQSIFSKYCGQMDTPFGRAREVIVGLDLPSIGGRKGTDRIHLHIDARTRWSSHLSFYAGLSSDSEETAVEGFFSDWATFGLPFEPLSGDFEFHLAWRNRDPSNLRFRLNANRGRRAGTYESTLRKVSSSLKTVRVFVSPLARSDGALSIPEPIHQRWNDSASRMLDVASPYSKLGIELDFRVLAAREGPDGSPWDECGLRAAYAEVAATTDFGPGDVWCFVAPGTGKGYGWMFDNDRRTGLAVFAGAFSEPPRSEPTNEEEHGAARNYLFTWVHELGHALGLEHTEVSLQELGSQYPSWMNPPEEVARFWERFDGGFHRDEVLFLKHGPYEATVPGAGKAGRFDLSSWGASW